MSRLWVLIAFMVGVFGGAAVLAPWVWWAAKAAVWPHGGLGWLADHPFSRYVHRCLLVLALVGIWPLTRAMGCGTWESAGWTGRAGAGRRVALGMAAGLAGFAILAGVELGTGARGWREGMEWGRVGSGVGRAVLSAAAVAVVEETLFRGVLFGGLQPVVGRAGSVTVTSLIYALLHFLSRPTVPDEVTWASGFETLRGMMGGFGSWGRFMPAFGTLYLLGILFGLSRSHDGNVHFAVGLHAGLVFWAKMRGVLTQATGDGSHGGDLLSGWLAFTMATGGVLIYYMATSRGRRKLDGSKQAYHRD